MMNTIFAIASDILKNLCSLICKFFAWLLKDWKRLLIFVLIALNVFLLLRVNHISNEYYNYQQRAVDTLSVYQNKVGELYASNDTYIMDIKELKKSNTELYEEVKKLKDNPIIVTKTEFVYKVDSVKMNSDTVYIYVDGNDISGLFTAVLKDRRILADNGLVAVVIAIDSKVNKILMKPVIVSRGFVFIKDSQSLIKEAEYIVYNSLQEKMKEKITFSEIKNCVRSTLEPFLYQKTHRNPIVIPVIINSKQTMEELAAQRKNYRKKRFENA